MFFKDKLPQSSNIHNNSLKEGNFSAFNTLLLAKLLKPYQFRRSRPYSESQTRIIQIRYATPLPVGPRLFFVKAIIKSPEPPHVHQVPFIPGNNLPTEGY